MATPAKRQLSLPVALSRDLERLARRKGKSTVAVLQDLVTENKQDRLAQEFKQIQGYWGKKAKEKGIITNSRPQAISREIVRVVFDTNIYISALILPGSSAHRAIQLIIGGHDRLLISKPILDEVLTTLARKFCRDAEALSRTALWVTELAELVYPETRVHVFSDGPDNRVLECAIAGKQRPL